MRPEVTDTTERVYAAIGPAIGGDEPNDWQLLKYLASVGDLLDHTEQWSRDHEITREYSIDVGGVPTTFSVPTVRPGWAMVMDPDTVPDEGLAWLGQFVGVKIDPSASPAQQRTTIKSMSGFARGSVAAIRVAARQYLDKTQRVDLFERDGSPYAYRVRVWSDELAGLSYSELGGLHADYQLLDTAYGTYEDHTTNTEEIEAGLNAVKPAGLNMTLEIISGSPP